MSTRGRIHTEKEQLDFYILSYCAQQQAVYSVVLCPTQVVVSYLPLIVVLCITEKVSEVAGFQKWTIASTYRTDDSVLNFFITQMLN